MDVPFPLTCFDHFQARHRDGCGVERLDVRYEETAKSTTRLTLTCPRFQHALSGSFDTVEWPTILDLLAPGRTNEM